MFYLVILIYCVLLIINCVLLICSNSIDSAYSKNRVIFFLKPSFFSTLYCLQCSFDFFLLHFSISDYCTMSSLSVLLPLPALSRWNLPLLCFYSWVFLAVEKEMATHSSILVWRTLWTEDPGGLPSMGSHRVGHDWSDLAAAAASWQMSSFP